MSGMELSDRRRLGWGSRSSRMLTVARLGALAGVLWGVAHQVQRGASGASLAVPLLAVTASLGWMGWMACRRFEAPSSVTWGCLAVLAVSGGALSGYAPFSVTFVAVGALGAGIAFDTAPAAAVGALGVAAVAVSVLALGTASPGEIIAEGALAAVAGLMAGASRRQYLARAHQAEQLLAERVRADVERDRAAALAERNRLGRELHDVLAHSLGALSVQLGAADALLEQGADPDRARELVRQARSLAAEERQAKRVERSAVRSRRGQARWAGASTGGTGVTVSREGEWSSTCPDRSRCRQLPTDEKLSHVEESAHPVCGPLDLAAQGRRIEGAEAPQGVLRGLAPRLSAASSLVAAVGALPRWARELDCRSGQIAQALFACGGTWGEREGEVVEHGGIRCAPQRPWSRRPVEPVRSLHGGPVHG